MEDLPAQEVPAEPVLPQPPIDPADAALPPVHLSPVLAYSLEPVTSAFSGSSVVNGPSVCLAWPKHD